MKQEFKLAFIKTLPVMAGYLVLGFGFGVILEQSGFGILWALAMSITIFAGSMQYVAVSLLSGGVSLVTAAITTLMVNARHLFYGISMIEPYKHAGKLKPYMMFGLTDETYSLVCTTVCPEDMNFHRYAFFVTLLDHIYWIAGGALGVLAGALIPINFQGVEFAMTALFITVFVEQWKNTKNHIPSIIGVLASVLCLVIFGGDSFLIPAMIAIGTALLLGKKPIERGGER